MTRWLESKRAVITAAVLTVAVPLVSMSVFVYFSVISFAEKRLIRETMRISELSARTIEERLSGDIKFGTAYATRPYLIDAIGRDDKKEMRMHLKMLVEDSGTLERAFIASPKGVLIADWPEDPTVLGKDFSGREWFKGVSAEWTPYISNLYKRSARPVRQLFAIAVPVKSGGTVAGVLVMQPKDDYVKAVMSSITLHAGHLLVVDRYGAAIYHSGDETALGKDFSGFPGVKKVLARLDGAEMTVDPLTGKRIVTAYHAVGDAGWGVILHKDEKAVLSPLRRITYGLILFTAVMLVVGIFFAYKGAMLLTHSRKLARQLREEERSEKAHAELLTVLNRPWPDARAMCSAFLEGLSLHSCMEAGVIYERASAGLAPASSFAVASPGEARAIHFECLGHGEMLRIRDIPEDSHLSLKTGTTSLAPKDIAIVPLFHKEEAQGVLELACMHGFKESDIETFSRIAPALASGMNSLKAQIALKNLADDLSRANEELQVMNEEANAMNEELKARQVEIGEANAKLLEVSRAKSDFLANMSHELRTPLNSIIGFSELLQDGVGGELSEKQREYIGDVLASGRHLLGLINDILDLAKVESGKMELEVGRFGLKDVLGGCMTMFREKAMKHGLRMTLDVEAGADAEVEGDERKLKQIMFNLLGNSVKFTPDGGAVRVSARKMQGSEQCFTCTARGASDFAEISVEDTGIGIRAEDMGKLFKEFTQLESPYTKEYAGTGLGLALTKRLVELHGGSIRAESEPGRGTKMTFTLPMSRPVADKTRTIASLSGEMSGQISVKTALIIDDDPKVLEIMKTALSSGGVGVVTALSGQEGIATARAERPDLIILDLMMPGMDGFDVISSLRSDKNTAGIPIIVVTAMSLSEDDRRRLEGRVAHITEKGRFSEAAFVEEIKKLI